MKLCSCTRTRKAKTQKQAKLGQSSFIRANPNPKTKFRNDPRKYNTNSQLPQNSYKVLKPCKTSVTRKVLRAHTHKTSLHNQILPNMANNITSDQKRLR